MNAFASSRLANGAGRLGVIAPLVPADQPDQNERNRKGARSATASASSTAGHKRKRVVSTDALFAEDDDDEDEDEEDAAVPASKSASSRKAPPQPQARSNKERHSVDADEDQDEEQAADQEHGDATAESSASKKRRTAPEERSSKKAVGAGLVVTALPQFNIEKKRRDPRFDPLCGDFDPLHFHRHYEFIREEKEAEISSWQAELRSGKSSTTKGARLTDDEREELRAKIQRAQQELQSARRQHSESSILQKWKSAERKAQKETGKGAFHLKKSEQKKLQLVARFQELKEKGGLQKFMQKKTKEVANRDHKYMPRQANE